MVVVWKLIKKKLTSCFIYSISKGNTILKINRNYYTVIQIYKMV